MLHYCKKHGLWHKTLCCLEIACLLTPLMVFIYSVFMVLALPISIEFNHFSISLFVIILLTYIYFVKSHPKRKVVKCFFALTTLSVLFFLLNFFGIPLLHNTPFFEVIKTPTYFLDRYDVVYSFIAVSFFSFLTSFAQFVPRSLFKYKGKNKEDIKDYFHEMIICFWTLIIFLPPIIYLVTGVEFFAINIG